MKLQDKSRKVVDMAIAAFTVIVLMIIAGVCFDYYYEFNDDVLMKDILSGAYTGTASGRNIQMLAPIGFIISLFYKVIPGVAWYGIFLCACHYGCALILTYRAIRISPRKRGIHLAVFIAFLFYLCFLLPHLVMAQYTITVAVIAATAAFVFYTIPYDLDEKSFFRQAIPAVLMVILAYNIRSEMLLLMLPFIAITGLSRWNRESSMFGMDTIKRYLFVVAAIGVGMLISFGIDKLAYSSGEWKTFISEFNSRTKLYDYQYVPEYSENTEFYKSIGLSEADVNLLKNYDYALDDKINGDILGRVADYAEGLGKQSFSARLYTTLREYIYRLTHMVDGAAGIVILFLYVILIWAILARKESTMRHKINIILLRIGGLILMRSVSWLYIIWGHRAPVRITHSLYIIEIVILLAMVMVEFTSKLREGSYLKLILSVSLIGGGIIYAPTVFQSIGEQISAQERINKYGKAIDEYCSGYSNNFYFEDVYSTIIDGETFNEKMFENVDNTIKNYDLIGGWSSNSPLYRQKLAQFGITDIDSDILSKDNVFIICANEYDMNWVSDYYESQGIDVYIEKVDSIEDYFGVYKIWEVK